MTEIFSAEGWMLLMRLGFAVLLGGLIGMERGAHGRPAGFRTHILVCMGATMAAMIPDLFDISDGAVQMDRTRIISGLVTGIGFLGAGAILRMGSIIRGLTSAAGIWFTAVLGIIIGSGFIWLAVLCTAISLVVLVVFDRVNKLIPDKVYRRLIIDVEGKREEEISEQASRIMKKNGIVIQERYHEWKRENDMMRVSFQVKTRNPMQSGPVVRELAGIEGINRIVWE